MLGWIFGGIGSNSAGNNRANARAREPNRISTSPNDATGPPSPPLCAINDNDGWEYSEWDYVNTGIEEGWLIEDGWHFTARNNLPVIVYHYRLIS